MTRTRGAEGRLESPAQSSSPNPVMCGAAVSPLRLGLVGANNFFDGRGYVVTSDYKVYKCLKTPFSSGVAQGVTVNNEPNTTSTTDPQVTGDGYMWKFMYQIPASEVIKYVTNDFIPVKTLGAKTTVAGSGTGGGF